MAKTLAERITSARSTDRITLSDLERLIADATAERDRLSAASVQASGDSVNFALSENERDEAAAKADRLSRTATGLASEIEVLSERLATKRGSELRLEVEAEKASIIAERDALAERLKAEWPGLEAAMLELLSAIKASDDRMRSAAIHEASAEALARNCSGTFRIGPSPVRRLTEIKLPSFADAVNLAWPMPERAYDWVGRANESRRDLIKAEVASKARWEASWQSYRVTATPRARYSTEFECRRSPGASPSIAGIYNIQPIADGDKWATGIYCIQDTTAERLRKFGFEVELADEEAVA